MEVIRNNTDNILTDVDKIEALIGDSRAGFYPATNLEKNMALALLDYVGNPVYPAGIATQLQEVYKRQERILSKEDARQALKSITYEMGDFLTQAHYQSEALSELSFIVQHCYNPKIGLVQEADHNHASFAPLVRYMDLRAFTSNNKNEDLALALKTVKNQDHATEEKHKIIEDIYTGENTSEEIKKYIASKVGFLTIGAVRSLVTDAYQDQKKRKDFWQARLQETSRHGAAWTTGKLILNELGLSLK